ncbi:helix-turn-helix domain-containing protein [Streptomyces californicus]|uniref:helix-turn-helix domain-containing protein n=1 Tax=Streptomyces californicus TaxID=67351 RepID=UPI00296F7C02|nr:helix-turn-helix domain-containing protein [Streptomyces californicus]MDW4912586.1 helix-turn-helix domain-containing protein [Streptomyces californicus]
MAKQERGLITRQRVLRAAGEVFAERGYHGSSVSEIMIRARVTKGALYFHFASKEDMALGVLSRLKIAATISEHLAAPTRLQALIALVNSYAAPPRTDPILRGALRLAGEPEFESGIWHEQIHRAVADMLAHAAAADELLSHVDEAETAELITTMLAGLLRYAPSRTSSEACALARMASLWRHILPSIARPAVMPKLDLERLPPASVESEVRQQEDGIRTSPHAALVPAVTLQNEEQRRHKQAPIAATALCSHRAFV